MGTSKSSERRTRRKTVESATDSFVIGVDVEVVTEEMEEVSEGIGSGLEAERICMWFLGMSSERVSGLTERLLYLRSRQGDLGKST
jgi:hypothetical protein